MIVIKIDNTLQSFYNEMTRLKSEHPNLSFISYIDGEIGFRVILYNSLVYQFATKQRELNNFIVGLCFIGNTFYLKHYCDVVLEVQDIAFQWESFDNNKNDSEPVTAPIIPKKPAKRPRNNTANVNMKRNRKTRRLKNRRYK